MVRAAADGSVATWDFRMLSDSSSNESNKDGRSSCVAVRVPAVTMQHGLDGKRRTAAGPVHLTRGVKNPMQSILSVGSDAILR
jgi:hypothetical protein